MAAAARPDLSVVVASFSGEEALARCLDSLAPQLGNLAQSVEIVAATTAPAEAIGRLQARYPDVRFVAGDPEADVFTLRTLGVKHGRGACVALLEDHVTVGPRWLASAAAASAAGHGVFGGAVDNGLRSRAYHWALYLCEYGISMPPLVAGDAPAPASILTGVNSAYRRELLDGIAPAWERELHENEVNAPLVAAGERLIAVPGMEVVSHLPLTLGQAMRHLYSGARGYGRWRTSGQPALRRAALALASPLVPVVLLLRIARRTAERQPGWIPELVRALPYIALLLCAWSAGEAVGYLAGPVEREAPTGRAVPSS